MREIFPGVWEHEGKILTRNLAPGKTVYGEKLIKIGGVEYRVWNPYRSKLAAAIKNGLKHMFIRPGSRVLYLGAAEGTTASHVADIVGPEGIVFCVDISPRVMPKLIAVCEERKNMIPFLGDANKPEEYAEYVREIKPDVVYQDIAQPNQAEILVKNAKKFKIPYAYLAVKARSIDVTKDPREIFKREKEVLEQYFEVLEIIRLEPFEKDHAMIVCKRD